MNISVSCDLKCGGYLWSSCAHGGCGANVRTAVLSPLLHLRAFIRSTSSEDGA
jgi:hypothetical protein